MRKSIVLVMMISVVMCLCSCESAPKEIAVNTPSKIEEGNSKTPMISDQNDTNIRPQDKEIAYEITTNGDYNKLAMNFEELVQDSDFILKIRVEGVRAFVGDNGMIQTEITPNVLKVYKGLYQDQKLYVNGGEMIYDDFCKNEMIQKVLSGHEAPNDHGDLHGKYVRQSVDDQYIFNVGDEYIFFAKKREDSSKYYSLYAYQGTYKVVDGMVENIALDDEEALKMNLNEIFPIPSVGESTQTFSLNGKIGLENITTEETFTERINELERG